MSWGAQQNMLVGWFHGRVGYRRFYLNESKRWKHAHLFTEKHRNALCKQSSGWKTWFRKSFIDRDREVRPEDKCPECVNLSRDLGDKVERLLR